MSMRYAFKEGFAGMKRQKLAATGSILTLTISLILLGMFYLTAVQASRALKQIRSQVDIEVFLKETVSKNRLVEIQQQIQSLEGIITTEYVSKEDAAEFFKKEFGEDINKVLDFNPLPPSFKLTISDSYRTSENVEKLQVKLKAIKGVDDVIYRKDMLEFFDRRTKGVQTFGLAVGIFLALSAIFLVVNSIRLTIIARKQAIQIMKLVGATRGFIRAPYLIEGMLLGFIGGVLGAGLLFLITSMTKQLIPTELAPMVNANLLFYGLIVGLGVGLGFLGSMMAARKYIGESVL